MKAGSENGRRGYQLTYSIAYIRDFLMNYYIIAESFETSVSWSSALALCENVKRRLTDEYKQRRLPGKPFVTARVTQVYRTGVCIYFYFGFYYKGITNPHELYLELENIARDEILKSGGSLSHHHGVGKLRRAFLPRRRTWNVVAEAGDPEAARTVVVVAHHDAAHGGLIYDTRAIEAFARRFPALHARANRVTTASWVTG